ncbi:hypothetical protein Pla123a_33550 [Posidoniimonas polymericola]|uniref:Uncharacterized protein n=1 Tax=Posidoniimonas polymericola TaxID=2528002 RepID=A0A5C5YI69_9BACT|nr:hypothetical protein [Posidoniimonas polymericola]TWT74532.1 hypothetical protein Pla123a_33550 [Posidoniimonas polymericola]
MIQGLRNLAAASLGARIPCRLLALLVAVSLCARAPAQTTNSAWMWSSASHPAGAVNVLGDKAKEREMIANFKHWGFDRIYTSFGTLPNSTPEVPASWNASLDDANISSQMLFGLVNFSPTQMADLVQTRLVEFNNARTDPRERFDAVHLDLEPHVTSAFQNGSAAERQAILLELRDTYAAVRERLDDNGCSYVRIYSDLPVWFDNLTSNLGWANPADRNQWFDDIALSLDGFSMMAYERSTLSSIVSGVGYEVANFDGEVRIGLNVAEIGPGDTFASFDALLEMADSLRSYYGTSIGGIDFHALTSYSELAPVRLAGDFNSDGLVDATDYAVWRDTRGSTTLLDADGDFDGVVGESDYQLWRLNYGSPGAGSSAATAPPIPEPGSLLLCCLALSSWPIRCGHGKLRQ